MNIRQSTIQVNKIQMTMFLIKMIIILTILSMAFIKSGMARPNPANKRNHIMKNTEELELEIMGNETGMKKRQPKIMKAKNSDLIKALAQVDYEYEEYEEYDVPIIEIRFKREATPEEKMKAAFKKIKRDVRRKPTLIQAYLKWAKL